MENEEFNVNEPVVDNGKIDEIIEEETELDEAKDAEETSLTEEEERDTL